MLYSTYAVLVHVGYISHSHSLYLAVAIDQGLPGLLALIWMWVLFAAVVWHSLLQRESNSTQSATPPSLVGAAGLSLMIALLHGAVETALYGRGVLFLFVPLAFAARTAREQGQLVKVRRTLSLAVIGLPLLLALLWPSKNLSLIYSNLGAVHQSQEELSLYSWPEWPIQDAVRREVDLNRAVSQFEKALALNPRNPTANRRLGMIELSLGQYDEALAHLEAAYTAEPDAITTRQLLGEALIVNGHLEEGRALWSDVSNEQRQLELRAGWYRQIGDAERAAWIALAAGIQ
jgi:tetratricopeptide (TPR) repeat protein